MRRGGAAVGGWDAFLRDFFGWLGFEKVDGFERAR